MHDFPGFAERLYARPGVEAACLDLQDRRALDVPLLLHACWLGCRGRALDSAATAALVARTVPWRLVVVRALRRIRRRLKAGVDGMDRTRSEPVRQAVKAAELAAERVLVAVYAEATDAGPGGTVAGNLLTCLRIYNITPEVEDAAALAVLEGEAALAWNAAL
jgi:uncharacterized protein (TIGR02444 family)